MLLSWQHFQVPRTKRKGQKVTFSVSVSRDTKARLRKAADRGYGGNVSAVIEAIAIEADRQDALSWLLHRSPRIDDEVFEAFMAEEMTDSRRKAPRDLQRIGAFFPGVRVLGV
jgi:hypothetical protein